MKREVTFLP